MGSRQHRISNNQVSSTFLSSYHFSRLVHYFLHLRSLPFLMSVATSLIVFSRNFHLHCIEDTLHHATHLTLRTPQNTLPSAQHLAPFTSIVQQLALSTRPHPTLTLHPTPFPTQTPHPTQPHLILTPLHRPQPCHYKRADRRKE